MDMPNSLQAESVSMSHLLRGQPKIVIIQACAGGQLYNQLLHSLSNIVQHQARPLPSQPRTLVHPHRLKVWPGRVSA